MLKNKKMFDKLKGTISQFLPTIIAGLILFGIGIVLAGNWHSPTDNPPEGNVPQPLNVGGEWQAKDAPIGFNSVGSGHAGSVPTTRWIGNEGGTLYISAGTKWNTKQQLSIGMDGVITLLGDDKRITKVDDPIENDDVATKGWVLAQIGGGGGGGFKIMKDSCSCVIGYQNPCKCTASVDCGDGWQIIKGGVGTCLDSGAPIWAKRRAETNAGMGYAGISSGDVRQSSTPISFYELGSQTAKATVSGSISYNSAGAAIVVLCAKKAEQ